MRHASAVYQPMAMLAAMQLDLFTQLKGGPLTSEEIAAAIGVKAAKLAPLLYELVVAELLTLQDGRFSNAPEADTFLVAGRPASLLGRHENFADMWGALLKTAASIRANAPQARHNFHAMSEEELAAFLRGQHPNALAAGERLASVRDLSRFRRMLDAGAGSGGVTVGICRVCQELAATVADLPKVIPVTRQFLAEAGLGDRVSTVSVDLLSEPPEGTYDAAVVRNVIQVLSLEQATTMLHNVARSLTPGASLFVVGSMLDNSRLSPPDFVGLNLVALSLYDDGLIYTETEHRALLAEAGFTDVTIEQVGMPAGNVLISARKAN
jgi:hypothetical protein